MKFLFSILFYLPHFCYAQKADSVPSHYYINDRIERRPNPEKQWGITTSLNAGKYVTGNLGIAYGFSEAGFGAMFLSAVGINAEMIDPKRSAWGFGAEAWCNALVSMGIAVVDYTDLTSSRFCLRPMLGIGWGKWRFVYGYNIRLNKNDYKIFNTNMITLNYFFPVTHHRITSVDRKM